MEVEFTPRGTNWRRRGRQPAPVPPELVEALRVSYETQTQGNIPHGGAPQRELQQVVSVLERGAKDMGKHLRVQTDRVAIRFWVEDKP
jgi:hypothetical protein